ESPRTSSMLSSAIIWAAGILRKIDNTASLNDSMASSRPASLQVLRYYLGLGLRASLVPLVALLRRSLLVHRGQKGWNPHSCPFPFFLTSRSLHFTLQPDTLISLLS